jgi:hypothetical protein
MLTLIFLVIVVVCAFTVVCGLIVGVIRETIEERRSRKAGFSPPPGPSAIGMTGAVKLSPPRWYNRSWHDRPPSGSGGAAWSWICAAIFFLRVGKELVEERQTMLLIIIAVIFLACWLWWRRRQKRNAAIPGVAPVIEPARQEVIAPARVCAARKTAPPR